MENLRKTVGKHRKTLRKHVKSWKKHGKPWENIERHGEPSKNKYMKHGKTNKELAVELKS